MKFRYYLCDELTCNKCILVIGDAWQMDYLWERLREQVTYDTNSAPTNFLPTAFSDTGENEQTPLSPGSSVLSATGSQTLDSKLKSLILDLYSENSLPARPHTIERTESFDSFTRSGVKDPLTGNPVFPPQMITSPVRQKVMDYLHTMDPRTSEHEIASFQSTSNPAFLDGRPSSVTASRVTRTPTNASRGVHNDAKLRPLSAQFHAPLPVPGYAKPVVAVGKQSSLSAANINPAQLLNHDTSSPFHTVVTGANSAIATSVSTPSATILPPTSCYSIESEKDNKVDEQQVIHPHISTTAPVREVGRVPPLIYSPQMSIVSVEEENLLSSDSDVSGKASPVLSEANHNDTVPNVPTHLLPNVPCENSTTDYQNYSMHLDTQSGILGRPLYSPSTHTTGLPNYLLQSTRSDGIQITSCSSKPADQPLAKPSSSAINMSSTVQTTNQWQPINSNRQQPAKEFSDSQLELTLKDNDLDQQLQKALQSKARLEGELEAVVSECQSVLKDRAELQAKLARTEAELVSTQTPDIQKALKVKEHNEETLSSLKNELQIVLGRLDKELVNIDNLQESLEKEQLHGEQMRNDLLLSRQTIQQRESAIEELHEKLSTTSFELGHKKEESSQLQLQVSALQNSLETLEESKRWLHKQLQEAIQARVGFQEELRECKATNIAQSVQVEQLKKEKVFYQQQVSEMQQGIFKDKARLVTELEEIQANVQSQEDSYEMLATRRSKLEDQMEIKTRECEDLNAKIVELSNNLATAELELQEAIEKQKSLGATVEVLKQEKASLKLHVADSDACIIASNSALKEWDQAKTVLQGKVSTLERSLKSKDSTISALTDANGLLEKELENGQENLQKLGNEVAELKDQLMTLEEECRKWQYECSEKDKKMVSLSSVQSTLSSDTQQMRMQLAQKEELLMSKSIQLQSMEMQVKDLTKQMQSLQTLYEEFTKSGVELQESVSERDSALSQLNSTNQLLENKLAINEAELKELKASLLKAEQQKVKLEGQLESVSHANATEFQQLLQDKSQLQTELNSSKVNYQHENLKLQAIISKLESDIKLIKKDISRGEQQLRKELDNKESQIREKEAQIHQLENVVSQLNEELNSVKSSQKVLGTNMAEQNEMVQTLVSQRDVLQREKQMLSAHLQQEAAKAEKAEAILKVEISTIRRGYEEKEKKLEAQVKELMLELERHRGKLAGINTTQACIRNHAGVLEAALAQRESSLVKLSAQTKMVLAEKEAEDQAFTNRISSLEKQLGSLKVELQSSQQRHMVEKKRGHLLQKDAQRKESELNTLRAQLDESNSKLKEVKKRLTQLKESRHHSDTELASLRSQISVERSSLDTAQKILAERDKQLEILNKELSIARLQKAEIKEEARKLKEHNRIVEERQAMELDSMRQALDKSFSNQESLRGELKINITSHSEDNSNNGDDSTDGPSNISAR